MLKIRNSEEYEAAKRRAETLRERSILDGAEAGELVALLAAMDEWEKTCKASPLNRAKPSDFAAQ